MARITRDRAAPWPTGSVFALDGSIVPAPVSLSLSDIGWALGPVVGYNMQLGGFVLGFEGDIGWGNLSKAAQVSPLHDTTGAPIGVNLTGVPFCEAKDSTVLGNPAPSLGCSGAQAHVAVTSIATLRGRLGWIWTVHDYAPGTAPIMFLDATWASTILAGDYLFYGTGGIGWAKTSFDANMWDPSLVSATQAGTQAPISVSRNLSGPVFGGGIDFAPNVNKGKLHWGIEYLHYDLGGSHTATGLPVITATGAPNGQGPVAYTISGLSINDVRVRLTYRWD